MAGKFVLREKNDTSNPTLPRLYHLGITKGRTVFYLPNASGNRTGFIALLSEGARFTGDTGCGAVLKVLYAGFELPEFDSNGARNWKFHKGTIPTAPTYIECTMTAATNKVNIAANPFTNGDIVAFHKRGTAAALATPLLPHKQYIARNPTATDITLELNGDPVDLTADSVGDCFIYDADGIGLFDAEQGKPHFFPTLNLNFAGISYIEILLPSDLSDGEDEPSKLKVVMDGKQVYDFTESGGNLVTTGSPITGKNPAHIAYDALRFDGDFATSRFGANSWLSWRDTSSTLIDWIGGEHVAATPASFPTLDADMTYDPNTGGLSNNAAGRNIAATAAITARNLSAEFVYQGGDSHIRYGTGTAEIDGVCSLIANGNVLYFQVGGSSIPTVIGEVFASDRLKLEWLDGVCTAYRNGVPLSLADVTLPNQITGNQYFAILMAVDDTTVRDIRIKPSGTVAVPRQVERFTGGVAIVGAVTVGEVLENEIASCGGVSWQDVDGKIEILPTPDRPVVATFNADPNSAFATNCSRIQIKRRDPKNAPNYYRYSWRDLDDEQLTKKFDAIDRPERRDAVGYLDSGMIEYGVMTASQASRVTECRARVRTDLDVSWTVDAFLDTIVAAKGNFVYIIDPASGFDDANPALGVIVGERLSYSGDVETRSYEVAQVTPDFYDDTAHGAVVPITHTHVGAQYRTPPVVETIALTESTRTVHGAQISIIEGTVTFAEWSSQRGRLYWRNFGNTAQILADNGTNLISGNGDYSAAVLASFSGQTVNVFPMAGGVLPDGLDDDTEYDLVDEGGGNYSLQIDAVPVNFTTDGSGDLRIGLATAWQMTDRTLIPDPFTLEAPFFIDGVGLGTYQIRITSESVAGVTLAFATHTTAFIDAVGDLTAPEPPTGLECVFDGLNLVWSWQPSPSANVAGYYVTDGEGRIVQQFVSSLGYSEAARTLLTARRVYAVSRLGVRSLTPASLDFVLPPALDWVDPTGGSITEFGIFEKTAADGWNAGASFSWAVLTPNIASTFRTPPATETDTMRCFGLTRDGGGGAPYVTSNSQFYYGVQLNADGTVLAIWIDDPTFNSTTIGTYQVGDVFEIRFAPPVATGEPAIVTLWRFREVDNVVVEEQVHTYAEVPQYFPLYGAVAVHTTGTRITPYIEISGDLVPSAPTVPTWRNLLQATVSGDEFIINNGNSIPVSGWTNEAIEANRDGMFDALLDGSINAHFGICTANPSGSLANVPLSVHRVDDYTLDVYLGMAFETSIGMELSTTIAIARENGVIVIRKDGDLVYTADPVDTGIYPDEAFYLCIISELAGQSGVSVKDITYRQARPTVHDGNLIPVKAVVEAARFGEQSVYKVPIFSLSGWANTDLLTLNAAGEVTPLTRPSWSLVTGTPVNNQVAVWTSSTTLEGDPTFTYDGTTLTVKKLVVGSSTVYAATDIIAQIKADGGFGDYTRFNFYAGGGFKIIDRFNVTLWDYNDGAGAWQTSRAIYADELRSVTGVQTPLINGYTYSSGVLDLDLAGIGFRFTDGNTRAVCVSIVGTADAKQFLIKGHSTQNANLIELQRYSSTTPIFSISGTGNMTLADPTAATVGSPTVNSPQLILTGAKWRTDTLVSETMAVRLSVIPNTTNVPSANSPTLQIDAYSYYAAQYNKLLSIGQLSTDYLVTRYDMRNPHKASSWGGMVDVYYNGEFRFRDVAGDYSPVCALSLGRGSGLGYEQFYVNGYVPEIRTHFNEKILFAAGRPSWKFGDNAGNSGSEYVQSDLPIGIGTSVLPSDRLHIQTSSNAALGARIINAGTGASARTHLRIGESVAGDQLFTLIYANTGNAAYGGNTAVMAAGTGATGGLMFSHEGSYPIYFLTASAFRMTVQANGNVTIGTTYNGFSSRLVSVSTGIQFVNAYDSSNYLSMQTSSVGVTTITAAGTASGITVNAVGTLALNGSIVAVGTTADPYVDIGDTGTILRFFQGAAAGQPTGWAASNYTTRRTIDPSTDTLAQMMDTLCTVIEDLKSFGLFGA